MTTIDTARSLLADELARVHDILGASPTITAAELEAVPPHVRALFAQQILERIAAALTVAG